MNFQEIIKDLEDEIRIIEDIQIEKFGWHTYIQWEKDKVKLETAKQLKEIVEKAIDDLKMMNHITKSNLCIDVIELRKALGVETK